MSRMTQMVWLGGATAMTLIIILGIFRETIGMQETLLLAAALAVPAILSGYGTVRSIYKDVMQKCYWGEWKYYATFFALFAALSACSYAVWYQSDRFTVEPGYVAALVDRDRILDSEIYAPGTYKRDRRQGVFYLPLETRQFVLECKGSYANLNCDFVMVAEAAPRSKDIARVHTLFRGNYLDIETRVRRMLTKVAYPVLESLKREEIIARRAEIEEQVTHAIEKALDEAGFDVIRSAVFIAP